MPRQGSKSRLIYDWLKYGLTTWQIAQRFALDVELTRMLAHKFCHPERANYYERARRKGRLEQRVPRRNERDSDGWRVPTPGTKSRIIYGLLKYGLGTHEITASHRLQARCGAGAGAQNPLAALATGWRAATGAARTR